MHMFASFFAVQRRWHGGDKKRKGQQQRNVEETKEVKSEAGTGDEVKREVRAAEDARGGRNETVGRVRESIRNLANRCGRPSKVPVGMDPRMSPR